MPGVSTCSWHDSEVTEVDRALCADCEVRESLRSLEVISRMNTQSSRIFQFKGSASCWTHGL